MGKPVSFFLFFFLGLLAKVFLQSVHHKIEIIIHYSYCEQFHTGTIFFLPIYTCKPHHCAHRVRINASRGLGEDSGTHYMWYITLTKTLAGFCSASGPCGYYRMLTQTFPPVVSFKRRILEFSGGWLQKQSFLCSISVTFTWLYCWCLHHPSLVWVDDLHHRADEKCDTHYLVNISMSCKIVA